MTAPARLRALPKRAPVEPTWDELHAACILEQARRAEFLRQSIAEHQEIIAEKDRDYEQLADLYNAQRGELAAWRTWAADMPRGLNHGKD
jgi:hypothetical protein